MDPRRLSTTILATLALATAPGAAAAQSSTPSVDTNASATTELDHCEAEADELAGALASCQADRATRDGEIASLSRLLAVREADVRELTTDRARLAAELARAPDPVFAAGVGALVGASAVALVWMLAVR